MRVGHALDVAHGQQVAALRVAHHLGQAAGVGAHDRARRSAIASSADSPNDSSSEGSRNTSASPTISSIACCVAEEAHAVREPQPARERLRGRALRPLADHQQHAVHLARPRARRCAPRRARASPGGSSRRAAAPSGRAPRRRCGRCALEPVLVEVHEVRDDVDRLLDLELGHGHALQEARTPR